MLENERYPIPKSLAPEAELCMSRAENVFVSERTFTYGVSSLSVSVNKILHFVGRSDFSWR